MKKKIRSLRNNLLDLLPVFILGIIIILVTINVGVAVHKKNKYMEWYNTLPEEKQIIEKEKFIQKYEILNVDKYILPVTSRYNTVIGSETCYNFQYMDGDTLKTVTDFKELRNGIQQIIVGDKNMYIVDNFNIDTYYYLQLTEETLKSLEIESTISNNS
jgi:hypothetical protein